MKRLLCILAAAMLLLPGLAAAGTTDSAAAPRKIMELLFQGEYQQVFDQSTAEVKNALGSADNFAAMLAQLTKQFGAFQEIKSAAVQDQSDMVTGQVVCAFAQADVTFSVTLNADGLLAGLTVSAVNQQAAPSTADTTKFTAEPIVLRKGEKDATNGMLTLPKGDGPFPIVIMMQGSGASDMNETVFGIAPFRDLAEGLAILGVASIRYDKYTYAHADLLKADPTLAKSLTIQLEYLKDAGDALQLVQADKRIGDIYLLGHSEGAMILPRAMQALGVKYFTGGVVLEGSPLPLWEIQYHQNQALIQTMAQDKQAAAKTALDAEAAKLSELKTMTAKQLQATTFFGLSAYYQMDLMSVDTAPTAIGNQKPLFITQGGKDWQITPADGIQAWKAALDDKLAVTYKEYPNMNHMLCDMAGESAGNTSDYHAGDTVSQTLIGDIAAWVLGQ